MYFNHFKLVKKLPNLEMQQSVKVKHLLHPYSLEKS